jgi:hypothetical protein
MRPRVKRLLFQSHFYHCAWPRSKQPWRLHFFKLTLSHIAIDRGQGAQTGSWPITTQDYQKCIDKLRSSLLVGFGVNKGFKITHYPYPISKRAHRQQATLCLCKMRRTTFQRSKTVVVTLLSPSPAASRRMKDLLQRWSVAVDRQGKHSAPLTQTTTLPGRGAMVQTTETRDALDDLLIDRSWSTLLRRLPFQKSRAVAAAAEPTTCDTLALCQQ